jgi:Chlorite dismutase
MEGFYPSNSQAIAAPRVPRLDTAMFTTFRGGQSGAWRITLNSAVKGEGLLAVPALTITQSASIALPILPSATAWRLAGTASHLRYVEKAEKEQLTEKQAPLGRKEASFAALIPIRKSAAWWELGQDERREILEAKSHHISSSLKYLPQVARQLYHCRDLGEPFDFITWFEYAPEHAAQFEELVAMLRSTEEWTFVEREVDVRLRLEE